MEYHADPFEKYQLADYPVPAPVFGQDNHYGQGVQCCPACHHPRRLTCDDDGVHICSGPCAGWSNCKSLWRHPEEKLRRYNVNSKWRRERKAWVAAKNQEIIDFKRRKREHDKLRAETKKQQEALQKAEQFAVHQLGNPGEMKKVMTTLGVNPNTTANIAVLNTLLQQTKRLSEAKEEDSDQSTEADERPRKRARVQLTAPVQFIDLTQPDDGRQNLARTNLRTKSSWVPETIDLVDLLARRIARVESPKFRDEDSVNVKFERYVQEQKENIPNLKHTTDYSGSFIRQSMEYVPRNNFPINEKIIVAEDRVGNAQIDHAKKLQIKQLFDEDSDSKTEEYY